VAGFLFLYTMYLAQTENYPYLTENCFVNAPFDLLAADLLPKFLKHRLQPEIGFEGDFIWTTAKATYREVATQLHDNGLSCTLHAPFHDLTPGGFDPKFVELSRRKLQLAFELLPIFQPESIVCHLGYEPNKHSNNLERWLQISEQTWTMLLPIAEELGIPVMFENTYEPDPSVHQALLNRLPNHSPGFCLDTGHVLAFSSSPWQKWLQDLSPWIGQVHLHDNTGESDAHLAVGAGIFDFTGFTRALVSGKIKVLCTFEQRSEKDLLASIRKLHTLSPDFIKKPMHRYQAG